MSRLAIGNSYAFPFHFEFKHGEAVASGLTKRELFAAMAMQSLVVKDNYSQNDIEVRKDHLRDARKAAVTSIRYADALLAELAKDSE